MVDNCNITSIKRNTRMRRVKVAEWTIKRRDEVGVCAEMLYTVKELKLAMGRGW